MTIMMIVITTIIIMIATINNDNNYNYHYAILYITWIYFLPRLFDLLLFCF